MANIGNRKGLMGLEEVTCLVRERLKIEPLDVTFDEHVLLFEIEHSHLCDMSCHKC